MSDLISRQEAIDVLEEQLDYLQTLNKDENPTAENKWYGVNWARNTIADLPSAQPERPRGEWKIKKASIHPYGNDVCCSICGHTMGSTFGYKFCPLCGADMRGEE